MKKKNELSIFIGAQEISGMFNRINKGFHKMGIKSDFFCLYEYVFGDVEDNTIPVFTKYKAHTKKLRLAIQEKTKVKERYYRILQAIDSIKILIYAMKHYNCFLYCFGHGIFYFNKYLKKIQQLEFWLLKRSGKNIVMWFCGSDSRADYCDYMGFKINTKVLIERVREKKKNVMMLEKYAQIIDYQASAHFHQKPYIIYNYLSVVVDENEICKVEKEKNDKIKILHSPSDKDAKGTDVFREIIALLKRKYDIDYVEVTGKPHNEVLRELATVDIALDQAYSDTPMAGFAAEAAINEVPVVVGGYFAEQYKEIMPEPIPPSVFCEPEKLYDEIEKLICDKEYRQEVARKQKEYILNNSLPEKVCEKILKIFNGQVPEKYQYNPYDSEYIWGLGVNKSNLKRTVFNLVDRYGIDSLGISDKPKLLTKYMALYEEYKAEKGIHTV